MEDLADKISQFLSKPGAMEQVAKIAGSLAEDSNKENPSQESLTDLLDGVDMDTIMTVTKLISSAKKSDGQDEALLRALKPLVGIEKASSIDQAIKMLKIYGIAKAVMNSGLLKNLF